MNESVFYPAIHPPEDGWLIRVPSVQSLENYAEDSSRGKKKKGKINN